MRTMAERRATYFRLKDRRVKARYWSHGRGPHHWDVRHLGIAVDTPHPCSCLHCGNRRQFEGQTLAERKSAVTLREGLLEFSEAG